MTLREKIRAKIEEHADDTEAAAMAVCLLLEHEIDLAGNGWFDDDQAVLDAL